MEGKNVRRRWWSQIDGRLAVDLAERGLQVGLKSGRSEKMDCKGEWKRSGEDEQAAATVISSGIKPISR